MNRFLPMNSLIEFTSPPHTKFTNELEEVGYTHANRKTGRKERVCCTGLDNGIRPLVEKGGSPEAGVKVEQSRLPGGGECGVWTLSVGRVWLGRDVLSVPEDCEPPEH